MSHQRDQVDNFLSEVSTAASVRNRDGQFALGLQATEHTLRMVRLFYPEVLETNTKREMASLSGQGVTKYLAATRNLEGHLWGIAVFKSTDTTDFNATVATMPKDTE